MTKKCDIILICKDMDYVIFNAFQIIQKFKNKKKLCALVVTL
jgi:hypothetical protein